MSDSPELQISNDGSHTIISEIFQVAYHSKHGAITESNWVFIDAGLNYFTTKEKSEIQIFEMGFGTGLNALLSYIWSKSQPTSLVYHTVEAYPIDPLMADLLNYTEILGEKPIFKLLHSLSWNEIHHLSDKFSITKYHEKIEDLDIKIKVDVIYYDAFAPSSQPHLWEQPILLKMYEMLNTGGILVSYCAQGAFKRNLRSVGFLVESIPGPPGKREMTRAIKS